MAKNTFLKVKVMLPLFTTSRCMGSGGTVAFILTLITWWKEVDSFTPRPLYPQEKTTRYHGKAGCVEPRASLNTLERRQISCLCWGGGSLRLSNSTWLHMAPTTMHGYVPKFSLHWAQSDHEVTMLLGIESWYPGCLASAYKIKMFKAKMKLKFKWFMTLNL